MSQYSEEDLLRILEVGKMKSQARGLSEDEKKSIAKYLAKQNQSFDFASQGTLLLIFFHPLKVLLLEISFFLLLIFSINLLQSIET